jgi:D-sedoheptulose 7-phosphate isomerase
VSIARLEALGELAARCATELEEPVARYTDLVRRTVQSGGTIMFAGNGGSAAHAQHMATEYVVRYQPVSRRAISAIALSTDTSLLTAAGNDLGYDFIFSRQVEAHAAPGDLLVLVSTSGNSRNLILAAEVAKGRGVTTVGLIAKDGGKLAELVDLAIVVPTEDTALAQELQLAIDHHVCGVIEGEEEKKRE